MIDGVLNSYKRMAPLLRTDFIVTTATTQERAAAKKSTRDKGQYQDIAVPSFPPLPFRVLILPLRAECRSPSEERDQSLDATKQADVKRSPLGRGR